MDDATDKHWRLRYRTALRIMVRIQQSFAQHHCRHTGLTHISGGVATCPDCHQSCIITWVRARCSHCNHSRALRYSGWGTLQPKQATCPECKQHPWHCDYRHHCNYFTSQGALRLIHPVSANTPTPPWLMQMLTRYLPTPQAWVS